MELRVSEEQANAHLEPQRNQRPLPFPGTSQDAAFLSPICHISYRNGAIVSDNTQSQHSSARQLMRIPPWATEICYLWRSHAEGTSHLKWLSESWEEKKRKQNPNQVLLLIVRLKRPAPINTVQLSSQPLSIIWIAAVLEEIKIQLIKEAQLWQFFLPSNQTAHCRSIPTHGRNKQSSRLQHYYLSFRADWHSSMESCWIQWFRDEQAAPRQSVLASPPPLEARFISGWECSWKTDFNSNPAYSHRLMCTPGFY